MSNNKDDSVMNVNEDGKSNHLVTQEELNNLDTIAKDVINYSEDDRRKADALYKYYQHLIDTGDKQGETREGLAKALELRENSVNNLVEILKLKTRLMEKKLQAEMRNMDSKGSNSNGRDTSDWIQNIDAEDGDGT